MSHWASQYIGRPYEYGAQGPDSFDCWGFFRWVQREHYGREVPFISPEIANPRQFAKAFADHPEYERWERIDKPEDGAAVLMAHASHPSHIGIYLEPEDNNHGVIHCIERMGVLFQTLPVLRQSGWGHIEFYRFKA